MIKTNILLLVSLFIFLAQGCTKDTCNDEATFSEISATVAANAAKAEVNMEWQIVKDLPASYFDALFLVTKVSDYSGGDWVNDHGKVDNFVVSGKESVKLTLTEAAVESLPKTFSLHFMLPDRRDFIDCTHPGSGDDYFLDISFQLSEKDGGFSIEDFKWTETLNKGGM